MKTTSDCIGIREYLLRRRLQPHHETATHGMFLSPLREERTPSFSVRYDKGLWYDFGLGEGGTLLQLVMRLEGCSMAEAIRSLRKGSADEVPFQPLPTALPREDSPLRILGVGEIRHPALIGMRVDERTRAAGQFLRFIDSIGLPLIASLRDTQNDVQLAAHGMKIFDVTPRQVARDLVQWTVIESWLGLNLPPTLD